MISTIVYSLEPVALFGGGEANDQDVIDVLPLVSLCVAADGGAGFAIRSNVKLDAVIGDFDSLPDIVAKHVPSERLHRITEQDSTDFDKALRHIQAPVVLGIGFLGGRVDHHLAAFHVLARRFDRPCVLLGSTELVFLCPPRFSVETELGDVVSLFPLAPVEGTSTGLRWPIDGIKFDPVHTIGTSNEATGVVTLSMTAPHMIVVLPRKYLRSVTRALSDGRWHARAGQYTDQRQL